MRRRFREGYDFVCWWLAYRVPMRLAVYCYVRVRCADQHERLATMDRVRGGA